MNGLRRKVALTLFPVVLAACGFHLRGTAQVPFNTIYVPNPNTGLPLDLKRSIIAGTNARVVDDMKSADAILAFLEEVREKEILSLTGAGRVREFQLRYRVRFRVHDGKGGNYLPPAMIQLTRDVTFNDAQILAKEAEEQLLYRDMQKDMVQQIVRRLAAAKPPVPESESPPPEESK